MLNKHLFKAVIVLVAFLGCSLGSLSQARMTDVVMGHPVKSVELGKIDEASGTFVFFSKKYEGFVDIIKKSMPDGAEFGVPTKRGAKENHLSWIPVYLADLEGEGKREIFLVAPDKISGQKMLMVFDEDGNLMDQLPFEDSWPSYIDFGLIKKGGPICFGLHWCALSAHVCSSEFYVFCNGKIKPAFSSEDVSEDGNYAPPVFKTVDYKGICSGEQVTFVRKYEWRKPMDTRKFQ